MHGDSTVGCVQCCMCDAIRVWSVHECVLKTDGETGSGAEDMKAMKTTKATKKAVLIYQGRTRGFARPDADTEAGSDELTAGWELTSCVLSTVHKTAQGGPPSVHLPPPPPPPHRPKPPTNNNHHPSSINRTLLVSTHKKRRPLQFPTTTTSTPAGRLDSIRPLQHQNQQPAQSSIHGPSSQPHSAHHGCLLVLYL